MPRLSPAAPARDLSASLVVFLVALPLCMGIAVASGVPPQMGLLAGIVGVVVVGLIGGAPLQVSGPAAGLAVIVYEIVRDHGLGMLGPILLLAGLLQLAAGYLRLGHWFRAMSPAVVHGMLAGIGVLIVAVQVQILIDAQPLANGLANLAAIPAAFLDLLSVGNRSGMSALAVGLATITAMLGWERLRPRRLRLVPGALVGLGLGTLLASCLALPVKRVQVPDSILGAIVPPTATDLLGLAEPGLLLAALTIAIIASAETLLSVAAVDRMHDGPRADYNRELRAQGIGNALCGLIGGLPVTGVIVRSSANVQAGAASRLSAVLHGLWILALVAAAPGLLREVPTAALAGILVVTGWRLVSLRHARELFRRHGPLPAAAWAATLVMVVAIDLLTGVLVGFALALLEVLPHLRRPHLLIRRRDVKPGEIQLRLAGAATFLHLPRLARALEEIPLGARLRLDLARLTYVDHTCAELIGGWAERRASSGTQVALERAHRQGPHRRLSASLAAAG
jgi:MFS superfamily sulfate permease-like transporter